MMAPKTVSSWVLSRWAVTLPDYEASLVMAVTRSGR